MASSAPDITSLPYRPGVGVMLLNHERQVFVARRLDMTSEAWQMPQGGIDEGEEPYPAALRELEEETSVTSVSLLAELPDWQTYDLPANLVPKMWGGKFRGQKQKWYALRFEGPESEINLETKHPEFTEWRWVPMQHLPDLIVPFKREMYADLVKQFSPLLLS